MKGLFVINSLEGGGAEKVFATLISLIEKDRSKQYDIDVVLLDDFPEVYALPESVTVHRLGNRFGKIGQFIKFLALVNKLKPKFVLSFLFRSNHFNVIAGQIFKYASIISERSNSNGQINGRFQYLKKGVVKKVFARADAIVCVSQGVGECLIRDYSISADKIMLLNNSYDGEQLKALAAADKGFCCREKYIVAVGRLVKTKGFEDLIVAFSKADISANLKILGQGPELENLKKVAVKHGVKDKVEFCGFQKNPYPYVKHATLFVLSSYLEGFPNALVEAMALSKPVIAANCTDGPKEILVFEGEIAAATIKQAKYGLAYSPGDINALTSGLELLFNSPALLNKYAALSDERAKNFSRDKFYWQFKSILANVVEGL